MRLPCRTLGPAAEDAEFAMLDGGSGGLGGNVVGQEFVRVEP